jgi:hypothetical protein
MAGNIGLSANISDEPVTDAGAVAAQAAPVAPAPAETVILPPPAAPEPAAPAPAVEPPAPAPVEPAAPEVLTFGQPKTYLELVDQPAPVEEPVIPAPVVAEPVVAPVAAAPVAEPAVIEPVAGVVDEIPAAPVVAPVAASAPAAAAPVPEMTPAQAGEQAVHNWRLSNDPYYRRDFVQRNAATLPPDMVQREITMLDAEIARRQTPAVQPDAEVEKSANDMIAAGNIRDAVKVLAQHEARKLVSAQVAPLQTQVQSVATQQRTQQQSQQQQAAAAAKAAQLATEQAQWRTGAKRYPSLFENTAKGVVFGPAADAKFQAQFTRLCKGLAPEIPLTSSDPDNLGVIEMALTNLGRYKAAKPPAPTPIPTRQPVQQTQAVRQSAPRQKAQRGQVGLMATIQEGR